MNISSRPFHLISQLTHLMFFYWYSFILIKSEVICKNVDFECLYIGSVWDLDLRILILRLYIRTHTKGKPFNITFTILPFYQKKKNTLTELPSRVLLDLLLLMSKWHIPLTMLIYYQQVEMNGRLNPANSTWIKISDCGGMILEEQPAKLCESFRLFLQGMGYGKSWETPFKIHIPPVEDFGKVCHRGECKFLNAPTFCDF